MSFLKLSTIRKSTTSLRFQPDPLGESSQRLIDVLFAFVLGRGFVEHRQVITSPEFSVQMSSVILVYTTVILSWQGYHKSISKYPYNETNWSKIRFYMDVFILSIYAYLIFVARSIYQVLIGLGIVFGMYGLDGLIRQAEWSDKKVSKPWLSLLFGAAFFVAWYAEPRDATTVALGFGLVIGFRALRSMLGYPTLLAVGVDVDGVLCDQITPVLDRLRKQGKAFAVHKEDITDWHQELLDTDIAKEIEAALLDDQFIKEMPVIHSSIEGMKALYDNSSCHIVIATARPLESEAATIAWIRRFFKYHEFVNTRAIGKHTLGLDILIDDNVPNVKQFVSAGGTAILFTQPWNRDADRSEIDRLVADGKIFRAADWHDVLNIVNQLVNRPKIAARSTRN